MSWGTGDKQFVRNMFKKSRLDHKNNFFDEYLEPFFYTGLNEKRENQYFSLFNCKIPFLNGGLFEPLNNYRWSSAQFNIPDNMFSNDKKTGILDIFDLYNFTIDEEEPLEKDIAVDPEMLGKIFENLLDVKDRKSSGSFYTPREIVHYMCQESLANYIVNKLNIPYDDIINFIKYGDVITQTDWTNIYNNLDSHLLPDSIWNNLLKIDKSLIDVKIADPAVGSGAFPLGMLNEIVKLRDNISSYILIQEDKNIISRDMLLPEQVNRDSYSMKLQTIQNSIYAVDLEMSAVDIAKLRLWLSLIVDYPNDHEPRPLPNLDCKIMQGNSLLDEYEGVPLFSEKLLSNNLKKYHRNDSKLTHVHEVVLQQQLIFDEESANISEYLSKMLDYQKEYFITSDNTIKKELKRQIERIQVFMVEETLRFDKKKLQSFSEIAKKKSKPWFIWKLEFFDVFKNNNGFDIVIGNPPYVDSEHMMKTEDGIYLRNQCNKKYKSAKGNWDLFVIFVELGFSLLNDLGTLSLIIPNKLISANYTKAIRNIMCKKKILELRDYSSVKVFKEASVYPVTFVADNQHDNNDVIMRVMKDMSNVNWTNIIKGEKFYSSINWDTYFSENNENSGLIEKIDDNKKIKDFNNIFEVKGSATVNEAYMMKEMLINNNALDNSVRFVNTGTIDPFKCLWGIKDTQYIKEKYSYPIIKCDELNKQLPNRYADSKKSKIIIGGMTKIIESIYDDGNIVSGKSTIIILGDDQNLKYLIGLLNSKLMTFYYRLYYNSSSLEGGFYSINTEQIKNLPIIIADNYKNEIISLVNMLNSKYSKDTFEKLNKIIYKIYNLNDSEVELIENYCSAFYNLSD